MEFLDEHITELLFGSGGIVASILTYLLGKKERDVNLRKADSEADALEIENLALVISQLKEQITFLNDQLTDARAQIASLSEELKTFKSNIDKNIS